nr:MAG TPA: hypothetical protein [Caudoviricetes sp.]
MECLQPQPWEAAPPGDTPSTCRTCEPPAP